MRLFETALPSADRAGESATDVPEQLGFEQRLRNGAAVERDEPVRPPGTVVMNGPRDHFLAGPRFAGDQDRAARPSHRLQQLKQRLHGSAAAENAAKLIPLFELRSQVGVLGREPPLLHRFLKHVHQLVELKRLGDEVRRAALDRLDRVLHRAEPRDHNRDDPGIALASRLNHASPVHAGHPEVGNHDVESKLVKKLERSLAAIRFDDVEAALVEAFRHQAPQHRLVVYEQ